MKYLIPIFVLLCGPAFAESPLWKNMDNWTLRYGATYCIAFSQQKTVPVLSFVMQDNLEIMIIGLYNQDWRIPYGVYPITTFVDGVKIGAVRAAATKNDTDVLSIPIPTLPYAMDMLKFGKELVIHMNKNVYRMPLKDTHTMLPELINCAQTLKNKNGVNPFE